VRRLLDVPDARTLVGRPGRDALDAPFDDLLDRLPTPTDGRRVETFVTDHGKRFLDVDVRPFADAGGRENGRLFYLHDVTDRERRERELRRQNDQLERFASLVSHDLRNPLNVAEGYVEHAKATGDVAALDDVELAHDRMRDIIDDVLALAREGQTVTDVEPVEVAAVADRAWASVDTADATLVLNADATVLADDSRLRRLLENLFRNAVEHGGSDVTVTVGATGDGFYVADDGPGIPESERDQVLEDGYTTNEDGTGLGLSIVTSIANAHDWTVAVEDSADAGARFEFAGTTLARSDDRRALAGD
jgi:signal transduction histidine kinase